MRTLFYSAVALLSVVSNMVPAFAQNSETPARFVFAGTTWAKEKTPMPKAHSYSAPPVIHNVIPGLVYVRNGLGLEDMVQPVTQQSIVIQHVPAQPVVEAAPQIMQQVPMPPRVVIVQDKPRPQVVRKVKAIASAPKKQPLLPSPLRPEGQAEAQSYPIGFGFDDATPSAMSSQQTSTDVKGVVVGY